MTTTTTTFTYEYDDCGVLCRYNDRLGDWEVLEPHCLNCGYPDDNHDDNDCDWEDAPYTEDDTPASQRKWYKGMPTPQTEVKVANDDGYTYLTLPNYGILCRYRERSDVWERCEAHCLNCGYAEDDHDNDCDDYVAAPYTEGIDKEKVHLKEWTSEECDDWLDNHDDQENCLYLRGDHDSDDSDSDAETEMDEDQDNFTNRVCGYYPECGEGFHLSDPHYYDEEEGQCYCSEECFKKEQHRWEMRRLAEQDANADLNAAIDASGNCF
jgi:hypothetical protein